MSVIYRLFNQDMRLLYVGVADDETRRLRHHSKSKPWWNEVMYVQITRPNLRDRSEYEQLERMYIETEHPKYNIVHAQPERDQVEPPVQIGDKITCRWTGSGWDSETTGYILDIYYDAVQRPILRVAQTSLFPDADETANLGVKHVPWHKVTEWQVEDG